MQTLIAEGIPNASELKDFLQFGQLGLAGIALIVGAGLFVTAIIRQDLSETAARILKFFGIVMIVLFVLSLFGEMVPKWMDFYLKMHPVDPQVSVTIEMPPLNATNYKDYGPIEIATVELTSTNNPTPVPANQPRKFVVRQGTQFHIDLGNLTTLLHQAQQRATIARNEATKGDSTAGAGAPK